MAGTQAKRSSLEYATGRVGPRTAAKTRARVRRHLRVRKKVAGTPERPRLVVTRSSRHLFVQLVDDSKGVTLASASTYKLADGDKTAQAKQLGATLADAAKAAGITKVAFDRGEYKYHGRVQVLADAARKGGLDF